MYLGRLPGTTKEPWSAEQATGAPDTHVAADRGSAWATQDKDAGPEWLEVDYDPPLAATQVRIHETFNSGAIVMVIPIGASGARLVELTPGQLDAPAPRWLEVPLPSLAEPVRTVRIELDTRLVARARAIPSTCTVPISSRPPVG